MWNDSTNRLVDDITAPTWRDWLIAAAIWAVCGGLGLAVYLVGR
jgi:hypothetical protein